MEKIKSSLKILILVLILFPLTPIVQGEKVEIIKMIPISLLSIILLLDVLILSIIFVFIFKNKILRIALLFVLILVSILNMTIFPQVLKSPGQGDGLPEIISFIVTLLISPTIIFVAVIGILILIFKNKPLWVKTLVGGIFGGLYVLTFYLASQSLSHSDAGIIFLIIPPAWPLILISLISQILSSLLYSLFGFPSRFQLEVFSKVTNLIIAIVLSGLIIYLIEKMKVIKKIRNEKGRHKNDKTK